MREIKFRGWDAEGRKGWVYGDLVHNKKCNKTEPYLTDRVMVGGYEVVPESVGQFTGLKDIDGVDIYEGDIISYPTFKGEIEFYEEPVTFTDGMFCMDEDSLFSLQDAVYNSKPFGGVEIKGNVYERN